MEKVIFKNSTNVKFQQLKNVIGKDKLRPQLNGVFLSVQESKIVVTNGHCLFAYDVEIIESQDPKIDVIIDPKIFNQQSWLSVPKEDFHLVEFHVTEAKTEVFLGEEMVAVANNIPHEQEFPKNWLSVMHNSDFTTDIQVDAKLMKQAMSAIPDGFFAPKIEFGKKILIESRNVEEESIEVIGVLMPIMFGETKIYNHSEAIRVDESIIGRVTSKRVLKTWNEDFVDEDTGDVVSIERNEVLIESDVEIDEQTVDFLKDEGIKTIQVHKL